MGNSSYSDKMDIWSVGCIVEEMLTGNEKYHGCQSELEMLLSIFIEKGIPTAETLSDFHMYPIITQLGSLFP
jgi:serine/threonine protein kinase